MTGGKESFDITTFVHIIALGISILPIHNFVYLSS